MIDELLTVSPAATGCLAATVTARGTANEPARRTVGIAARIATAGHLG